MRKILLATDLEEGAINVAAFALTLADNFSAELTCYHAYGKPNMSYTERSPEERAGLVEKKMQELMQPLMGRSSANTLVHYVADVDYPGDGIIDQVKDGDYDLVVIGLDKGSDGENQFSSLVYRVLREAPTSVLAIPPNTTFQAINEIVFASDVDRSDEVVLEKLQDWRQKLTADLFVVHVYNDNEEKEHARSIMARWRDRYASRPNIHFELMAGEFEEDISGYVKQRGGDLLVLQSHTRGFFGSIFNDSSAAELAQTVRVPLLVMRGEEK